MKTHDIDAAVRALNPHQATDQVSDDAWAELSEAVTSTDPAPTVVRHVQRRRLVLVVRVVDPNADPKRYNEEFKRMGLDVTVKSVAASPPWVGRMLSYTGRNDHEMQQIRMLKPGEMYYHSSSSATDKGEVLAGLTVTNKTIDQVLPLVHGRGVTKVEYLDSRPERSKYNEVTSPPGQLVRPRRRDTGPGVGHPVRQPGSL